MHPLLGLALEQELKVCGLFDEPGLWFYEASLILKTPGYVFANMGCFCDPEDQLKRLMARSHVSEETAQAMIGAQWSHESKVKLADFAVTLRT